MTRRLLAAALLTAIAPLPVAAQMLPGTAPAGITATGYGTVRQTADAVRVVATVNPAPGVNVAERLEAVTRAFQADGMSETAVGFNGTNVSSSAVSGIMRAPTIEKMRALARDVASPSGNVSLPAPDGSPAPSAAPRVMLVPFGGTNLNFSLLASDCSGIVARAQAAAIAAARENAQRAAMTAGVRLGDLTGLSVSAPSAAACSSGAAFVTAPYNFGQGDAAHPFDFSVVATATVTFAIGGNGRRAL